MNRDTNGEEKGWIYVESERERERLRILDARKLRLLFGFAFCRPASRYIILNVTKGHHPLHMAYSA